MTIKNWITTASADLHRDEISTSTLDTEVLLSDILSVDRSWLHAHPEFELTNNQLDTLNSQIKRRKNHEPLAYIRGKQEFYGREFYVTPDTLTPRPETETMIEMFLEHLRNEERRTTNDDEQRRHHHSLPPTANSSQPSAKSPTPSAAQKTIQIIDIGTGSGCIIITAALELMTHNSQHTTHYLGLDISKKALQIAQKNVAKHKTIVGFKEFDLRKDSLSSFLTPHSSTIILANLPYVPNDFHINLAASHEPSFAIFGGEDGLDYYRLLFERLSHESGAMNQEKPQTRSHNSPPYSDLKQLTIFTEALPPQHKELERIANVHGFALIKSQDFILIFSNLQQSAADSPIND